MHTYRKFRHYRTKAFLSLVEGVKYSTHLDIAFYLFYSIHDESISNCTNQSFHVEN